MATELQDGWTDPTADELYGSSVISPYLTIHPDNEEPSPYLTVTPEGVDNYANVNPPTPDVPMNNYSLVAPPESPENARIQETNIDNALGFIDDAHGEADEALSAVDRAFAARGKPRPSIPNSIYVTKEDSITGYLDVTPEVLPGAVERMTTIVNGPKGAKLRRHTTAVSTPYRKVEVMAMRRPSDRPPPTRSLNAWGHQELEL